MSDYETILNESLKFVEEASRIALSYFRQSLLIEMKENNTPVTIADKKTEEFIRKKLSKSFPSFGILGEEFGGESIDREYCWTIDPIDGTQSFVRGIPLFGTLVGLLHHKKPVLGIMVLPALQETYTATKGGGTYSQGIRLKTSRTSVLESALISCGDFLAFDNSGLRPYLTKLMSKAHFVRGYTDCFGHALVIRGAVDAMIDPIVSPWDVAPIACLVEESGGHHFSFDGKSILENTSFVSCNPGLFKELSEL